MGVFNQIYITNVGKQLLSKVAEGKILKFIRFEIGDGKIETEKVEQTKLSNKLEEYNIEIHKRMENGEICLGFVLNNHTIKRSLYLREVGLFAEDPDTHEHVLVAYGNAGDECEYIEKSNTQKEEKEIDIILNILNSNNVNIVIDENLLLVTQKEFERKIKEYDITSYHINNTQEIKRDKEYKLPGYFVVGKNKLEIFFENVKLVNNENYIEIGQEGEESNSIQFLGWDVPEKSDLEFRIYGEIRKFITEEMAIKLLKDYWISEGNVLEGCGFRIEGTIGNKYDMYVSDSSTTAVMNRFYIDMTTGKIEMYE